MTKKKRDITNPEPDPKDKKDKPTIFPKHKEPEEKIPDFKVDPSRFGREIPIEE